MNTSGLQVGGGLLLIILLCYVGGRIHQWSRGEMDRDDAYRQGYDDATRSLFALATRVTSKIGPTTHEIPAVVSAVPAGQHHQPDVAYGQARTTQPPRPFPRQIPVEPVPTPQSEQFPRHVPAVAMQSPLETVRQRRPESRVRRARHAATTVE